MISATGRSPDRRADGGADDRLLGDRRVEHPLAAKPLEQPHGYLERTARRGHVLTEENASGSLSSSSAERRATASR